MLVLSRKKNEEVVIGDNEIVITVIEVLRDKVRLGFSAKKQIAIHRREVFEAIQKDKAREIKKTP